MERPEPAPRGTPRAVDVLHGSARSATRSEPRGASTAPTSPSVKPLVTLREDALRQHQRFLRERGTPAERQGAAAIRPNPTETVSSSSASIARSVSFGQRFGRLDRRGSVRRDSVGSRSSDDREHDMFRTLNDQEQPPTVAELSEEDLDNGRARGPLQHSWWVVPKLLLVGSFPNWTPVDAPAPTQSPSPASPPYGNGGPRTATAALCAGLPSVSDRDDALHLLSEAARVETFISLVEAKTAATLPKLIHYAPALRELLHPQAGGKHIPARHPAALWLPMHANTPPDDEFVACFVTDLVERLVVRREILYLHCIDGRLYAQALAALLVGVLFNKNTVASFAYVQRCFVSSITASEIAPIQRSRHDGAETDVTPTDSAGPTAISSETHAPHPGRPSPSKSVRAPLPSLFREPQLFKSAFDRTERLWREQVDRLLSGKSQYFAGLIELLHGAEGGALEHP